MTHPSTAKLIEISKALLARTKQGRLTWVPTEKPDVFEVDFPDYSIRIVPQIVTPPTAKLLMAGKPYQIEIYDNEGRLIEAVTSYEMGNEESHGAANIVEVLAELYELARRQALNTDKALNELLSRLSS